jgi:hypothetical protein
VVVGMMSGEIVEAGIEVVVGMVAGDIVDVEAGYAHEQTEEI